MYQRILVAIENSPADRTILAHVSELARLTGAELLLVHVADGWAARNFDQLKLRESEEMKIDRDYLDRLRGDLQGYVQRSHLSGGNAQLGLSKCDEPFGVRADRVLSGRDRELIFSLTVRLRTAGHSGARDLNGGSRDNGGGGIGYLSAYDCRVLCAAHL